MSETIKTDPAGGSESHAEAPAAGSNGTHTPTARRTAAAQRGPAAARSEPAPKTAAAQTAEPCDDCPPAPGRDYSAGLGWLMIGAAIALAFIGGDLATRGGLSRRLGAGAWDDER